MIDGPHIWGFSPVAFCINLTSVLASDRLVSSVSWSIYAATLIFVGLVWFSAISSCLPFLSSLTQCNAREMFIALLLLIRTGSLIGEDTLRHQACPRLQ